MVKSSCCDNLAGSGWLELAANVVGRLYSPGMTVLRTLHLDLVPPYFPVEGVAYWRKAERRVKRSGWLGKVA